MEGLNPVLIAVILTVQLVHLAINNRKWNQKDNALQVFFIGVITLLVCL